MEKKSKKKLTVEELDLEQLEGVTGGTTSGAPDAPDAPDAKEVPFKMNTGKPLPIMS
ncbi:hypothetical protein [Paraliomyxa miuraensis]|uniref:hypothetical protein n=1 Tax=Paraliomyxa miuraensis TaxID=376150 RepID=UPI002257FEBF|nr:hypothetical protein [Paraliomyxa miuraensis]MCX4240535.1 hypothetical protein [Paraliomyxa miuraensis]